ncbi:MAG TPA: ATP-binding protein [Armatimonadota bacterium]|nr:ATP-binding protein [Armatimonadota bacterium]
MARQYPEVPAEQLRNFCDPNRFKFETTDEVEELLGTVGQDRGVSAIQFGFDIKTHGFNLFVAGLTGTGRSKTVQAFVTEQAKKEPVPDDLCYVHNFKESDSPDAIILPAGMGCQLVKDMDELVEAAKTEIPRAFESENYEKRKNDILNEVQQERSRMLSGLEREAGKLDLAIEMTQIGIVTIPLVHGKPISREDFERLPGSQRAEIERRSQELQDLIQQGLAKARKLEKGSSDAIEQLDREVGMFAVGHPLDELRTKYREYDEVIDYLQQVQANMMDSLEDFKAKERPKLAIPGLEGLVPEPSFDRYKVNLIVDNQDQQGAPVVCENNPTYYNLIGRVDFRARLGALVTDFTQIKAGALHKANGGYLILQAMDVLTNSMSWDALKRTLRSSEARIENIAEYYGLIPTSTLKPEPIPVKVKVILIGSPYIYHLLYAFEEDFRKLFKVKADFDTEMSRSDEHIEKYAQFINARIREANLRPFHKTGVAKIVEYGSRLIQDKEKLSTRFIEIADMVSESSYWAAQNGNKYVMAGDVQKAIDEKVYRSNLIEQKIQELIEEGVIMIDTEGAKVGQVNGLSVYSIGDYTFGRPSRITARTYIGKTGVTNIERETKMSGPIHHKGVLILSGYMAGKYAEDRPLPLGASLTFEQLYEEVEGDSASSTELYALLSSLADLSIRQDIAVTGSVNQNGEIQPIGGVIQKVEGFYEVCKAKGLTGSQGVMIPHQNVRHLMLKEEVVDAVRQGTFHVWPVKTIDEGIEILTGIAAGEKDAQGTYPPDSVHGRVNRKLQEFAEKLKEYGIAPAEEKKEEEEERRLAARGVGTRGR